MAPEQPLTAAPEQPTGVVGFVRDAVSAMALALKSLGSAISMAVLIFAGPLAGSLPRAIAVFVLAGAITAGISAWRSQFVPSAAIIQDGPTVVMATVAAAVVAGGGTGSDVIVLLVGSTLLTGIVMWLMGRYGLGGLVRYVPTTVVGAFIAGTGWILCKGGLDVMVGFSIQAGDVGDLVSADLAARWLPGVAVGVAVWLIGRSDRLPPVAMSVTIVAAGVGFYAITAFASSVDAVKSGGWLIGPFPEGTGLELLSASEIADANWSAMAGALPGVASVVAVALLALLLNVTGLESITGKRVDVDRELRTAGVTNIVASPLGAASGFIAISDTVLVRRMKVTRRIVPVAGAMLAGLFGVFGLQIIGYVPRILVGALLVTVGVGLLFEWLGGLVRMVSKVEQLLSIAIVMVIAVVGILEGIGVGVVAACAVFIVRYSRIDPVRRAGGGHGMRSRVDRSPDEVATLTAAADRLAVFELQGYLFFGSLTTLGERVRAVIDRGPVDALILDFRAVPGIDTTGYEAIGDVVRSSVAQGADVTIANLDDDIRGALVASDPESMADVSWTGTLDEALERTEEIQLDRRRAADDDDGEDDTEVSAVGAPSPVLSYTLSAEFSEAIFEPGVTVMRQGDESSAMFVVVTGTLTAYRIDGDGARHRLRRFGAGAMVGEMGMVTGDVRSAEIVADTRVVAIQMSAAKYATLRRDSPHLAFELHEYIMKGQAARVVSLSEGVARLSQ